MLATIVNYIGDLLVKVVSLLPDSPFTGMIDALSQNDQVQFILSFMNYFLPIPQMLAALGVWLTVIASYYIILPFLRWTKAVSS